MLEDGNPNFGYNAATGQYEDLMQAGIIDPAKVSGQLFGGLFSTKHSKLVRSRGQYEDLQAGRIDPAN